MRKVKFLVMSVGPVEKNGTCKYMERIGGTKDTIVVLPEQFKKNADGYRSKGFDVYLYDERKYINDDFEFFGFRPRNCGGVGRQGIAEAVDALDDGKTLFFQMDDDTGKVDIFKRCPDSPVGWQARIILDIGSLKRLVNALHTFYERTGIKLQAKTGATPARADGTFFSNRKIFNNFIMYKSDGWRGEGFRALCSDDVRYNYYKSLCDCSPLASTYCASIAFTQNQGDRTDGNAPMYNKDCSWKKSYVLRMINPIQSTQYIAKEEHRILFRETLQYNEINPPVFLSDKDGNITGQLVFN